MFLKTVMERNQPLVRLGIEWQQNGVILPDTYLLDYDTILENARSIKQAGDANGVQNFFRRATTWWPSQAVKGRGSHPDRPCADRHGICGRCVRGLPRGADDGGKSDPPRQRRASGPDPPGGPEKDPPRKAGDRNGVHAGKSPRDQRSLHRATCCKAGIRTGTSCAGRTPETTG